MKKIFISLSLMLSFTILFAQSNNPYNQTGLDIVNSIKMVKADFDAGKVKEFNQETFNHYLNVIPLQKPKGASDVGLDLVSAVVKGIKNPNSNINEVINNSSFSLAGRDEFLNIVNIQKTTDKLGALTLKTNDIINSSMPSNEKQILLILIATHYNLENERINSNGVFPASFKYGNTLPMGICPPENIAFGCSVGAIFGQAFGPWGIVIGCVVGGILGALT
jgi:hypothetical protein